MKFSLAIQTQTMQNLISSTLGDKEIARKFVADISSVVAQNPSIQQCDANSIIVSGLVAQSLNLPLSSSLGFAYIVPFNTYSKATKSYVKMAQFQIGWKGLVQLAIRTGQYKTIGVREIHEGEYKGMNKFGEDEFAFSHDYDNKPIIGYYAYLETTQGFEKTLYWSIEKIKAHGQKYSKTFENGQWNTNFDAMARKTVLKQLISKWGVMSADLNTAVKYDQAVIKDNLEPAYIDNPKTQIDNSLVDTDFIEEQEAKSEDGTKTD